MSVASVTITYGAFADARVSYLAQLAGFADHDHALGKLARLWGRCTFLGTDIPGLTEIRAHLGPHGEEHLVECGLGERTENGDVRVRGAIAEDGTPRLGWYRPGGTGGSQQPKPPGPGREQRSAAGASRASKAVRGPGGKFVSGGIAGDVAGPAESQRTSGAGPAGDQRNGSAGGSDLESDQDPERSPARAGVAGPAESQRTSGAGPAGPVAGASVASSYRQRMAWWQAMLDTHRRLRDQGIKPNTQDLPKSLAPGGVHERNLSACERSLRDAGDDEETVDRKMRHVIAVAEAEAQRPDVRHLDWFIPSLIWDPERFARAVDTTLEKARTGPAPRRPPPTPPRGGPDLDRRRSEPLKPL